MMNAIKPFPARAVVQPGSEHVLVVEDDAMIRDFVVRQLASLGYRVSEAPDGPTGLEIIRKQPDIDLLFTDIMMPGGMSGYDLAEAAKQLRPDLRILFTSGYSKESVGHSRLNSMELLRKPYRRQDLASRLRMVFEGVDPAVLEEPDATQPV